MLILRMIPCCAVEFRGLHPLQTTLVGHFPRRTLQYRQRFGVSGREYQGGGGFISPPNIYMSNTWLVPGITGGFIYLRKWREGRKACQPEVKTKSR